MSEGGKEQASKGGKEQASEWVIISVSLKSINLQCSLFLVSGGFFLNQYEFSHASYQNLKKVGQSKKPFP